MAFSQQFIYFSSRHLMVSPWLHDAIADMMFGLKKIHKNQDILDTTDRTLDCLMKPLLAPHCPHLGERLP